MALGQVMHAAQIWFSPYVLITITTLVNFQNLPATVCIFQLTLVFSTPRTDVIYLVPALNQVPPSVLRMRELGSQECKSLAQAVPWLKRRAWSHHRLPQPGLGLSEELGWSPVGHGEHCRLQSRTVRSWGLDIIQQGAVGHAADTGLSVDWCLLPRTLLLHIKGGLPGSGELPAANIGWPPTPGQGPSASLFRSIPRGTLRH